MSLILSLIILKELQYRITFHLSVVPFSSDFLILSHLFIQLTFFNINLLFSRLL